MALATKGMDEGKAGRGGEGTRRGEGMRGFDDIRTQRTTHHDQGVAEGDEGLAKPMGANLSGPGPRREPGSVGPGPPKREADLEVPRREAQLEAPKREDEAAGVAAGVAGSDVDFAGPDVDLTRPEKHSGERPRRGVRPLAHERREPDGQEAGRIEDRTEGQHASRTEQGVTTPGPSTLRSDAQQARTPAYDIEPLLYTRWSPRAMTGRALADEEFLPLFEAARWAPSSFNSQFWRFVICRRTDPEWDSFVGLLTQGNRIWAKDAAVLVIVTALRHHPLNGKPAPTHMLDCGAACQNMALEGARRGLVVHGMEGFDYGRARDVAGVDDEKDVLAMFAIGERGDKERLPEKVREREKPSDRLPVAEIVHWGRFGRKRMAKETGPSSNPAPASDLGPGPNPGPAPGRGTGEA